MSGSKADIIAQLKKEILPLQGYKPANQQQDAMGLGPINEAFPNQQFPLAAIHEFCCTHQESLAATGGFIAGILSAIHKNGGAAVWIGTNSHIFPPALNYFGLHPERFIFVMMKRDKDIIWAMEEALKCSGLMAVIGEMSALSFTASRRFQLAVEETGVTGFIIRTDNRILQTNACMSRWKINPIPTITEDELPGLGFPRWQVELVKIRNGKPGSWQLEWASGRFQHISPHNISSHSISSENELLIPERKAG